MIELPKSCEVNRFIPKKTFYEKVNITSSIKQEFVNKLDKIIWKYKLSEDNIHLAKTKNVEEIEIFELYLKERYDCKNLIRIITKVIPYPILFFIRYENDFEYAIKFEEDIFFNNWNEELKLKIIQHNLERLLEDIVKAIINIESTNDINKDIQNVKKIQSIEKEISRLENKIQNTKQFNIKVGYNKRINELKKELRNYGEK